MKLVSCLRAEGVLYTVLRVVEKALFLVGLLPKERRLEAERRDLVGQNARLEAERRDLVGQNTRLEAERRDLVGQNARLEAERRDLVGQNARLEAERRDLVGQNARLEAECALGIRRLEQVLASYADYVNPEIAALSLPCDKKNVLLVGYYGAYNLGDEMMRQTLLKELTAYSDIHVTVMVAENPSYHAVDLGGVDIVHYSRTNSDYSHLSSRFDALLIGGGALLDDQQYQQQFNHFQSLGTIVVELPRYFAAKGKPVYCLGLSTNVRIKDALYWTRVRSLATIASLFSVRDGYSRRVLVEGGVPESKIAIVDDLVLADALWQGRAAGAPEHGDVLNVGIVWISVLPELRGKLQEVVRAIIRAGAARARKVQVTLIPFFDFRHCDLEFYGETLTALSPREKESVAVADYPYDLSETTSVFSGQDVMVNLRYHAALVCGALGIPQVVGRFRHPHYENKMRWVMDEFGGCSREKDVSVAASEFAECVLDALDAGHGAGLSKSRAEGNNRRLKEVIARLHEEVSCTTI